MKRRAMTQAMAMLLAATPALSLHAQGDEALGSRFFRTVITRNAKPLLAEAYFYDTEGVLVMQGLPLVDIISKAYGLQNFQIVDAPEWVRTAHLYDIKATLPPAFVESSETEMLQAMLSDRFQLTAHTTEREITTLALTLEDETPGFSRSGAWGGDAAKYLRYSHSMNSFEVRVNVTMQEATVPPHF